MSLEKKRKVSSDSDEFAECDLAKTNTKQKWGCCLYILRGSIHYGHIDMWIQSSACTRILIAQERKKTTEFVSIVNNF